MSRYRPPAEKQSRYITPEGARALREELHYLWKEKRPQVTRAVSEAAALGDRSENAEYIYGKKQLREIDRRVRFLTKRLDHMQVIDRLPENQQRIYFGAQVELEDDQGKTQTIRIVGADETHLGEGYISIDAPLARALVGKMADDEVRVTTPDGEKCFWVLAVSYR